MLRPLELIPAADLIQQAGPGWSHARWRLLAAGDSWLSIGALSPLSNANLLQSMAFSSFTVAAHCAYPGHTLRRISAWRGDPLFRQLLAGNASWRWDAIVLSAGGNDLIEAAGAPPASPAPLRLLRTAAEAAEGPPGSGAARHLNPAGWQTFARYFRANLDAIVRLRDSKSGENGNQGRPLCMHTYAYPTPRPSGAGLRRGPWLWPAMQAYGVPEAERPALARLLLDQLAELMRACAADTARYPGLHVFDSRALPVVPAAPGSTGVSGDWLNEVHLTRAGYRRIARPWSAHIEQVMRADP